MCREPGMSAWSHSHGGSSCGDFTFGSWQFVGARQEAEELQTHSAPRCWQLLPGSELVKCSFIGLPFPTGAEQEALEGRVAFPILSLTPLGFSEHFGMVGRESPLVAGVPLVLNTDCPWQRNGRKARAAASGLIFPGLGRAACFQGSQGAAPGEVEQSPPGEHGAGEQGTAGWRDTSTWKELTLPLSKGLEGGRTKQARENQGRTKWCWWEKAFQLLGKGEGMAEQGCWAGGSCSLPEAQPGPRCLFTSASASFLLSVLPSTPDFIPSLFPSPFSLNFSVHPSHALFPLFCRTVFIPVPKAHSHFPGSLVVLSPGWYLSADPHPRGAGMGVSRV